MDENDRNKINLHDSKTESYRIELQKRIWVWFSHKLTMLVPPTVSNAKGFIKVALQGAEHFFVIIACHLQIQGAPMGPTAGTSPCPHPVGPQLRLCNVVCRQTFLCPEMWQRSSSFAWKKREETALTETQEKTTCHVFLMFRFKPTGTVI